MGAQLLAVDEIAAGYGDLQVLQDVSLTLDTSEFVGVVGANGVGKSTLGRAIVGLLPLAAGTIRWQGADLAAMPPHRRAELGIVLVPEGRGLFGFMTVEENLKLGATVPRARARMKETLERAYALFPALANKRGLIARSLSGGQQQMLAIARALMAQPQLLILDEPSIGLAPNVVDELFELFATIHGAGTSILLIEQDVQRCLSTVERAYVMANGRIVMSGAAAELLRRDEIRSAYLGL